MSEVKQSPVTDSSSGVSADPKVLRDGGEYMKVPKSAPAFERIDSWLLRAFAGMPTLSVPAFSKKGVPTRVFEMRDYESHSEERAIAKMEMFNNGEIEVMQEVGMDPADNLHRFMSMSKIDLFLDVRLELGNLLSRVGEGRLQFGDAIDN